MVSGEASQHAAPFLEAKECKAARFFLTLKRSCTPKWRLLHQQRSWPEPHSGTRGRRSPPCSSVPTRPGETRERRSAMCFSGVCFTRRFVRCAGSIIDMASLRAPACSGRRRLCRRCSRSRSGVSPPPSSERPALR